MRSKWTRFYCSGPTNTPKYRQVGVYSLTWHVRSFFNEAFSALCVLKIGAISFLTAAKDFLSRHEHSHVIYLVIATVCRVLGSWENLLRTQTPDYKYKCVCLFVLDHILRHNVSINDPNDSRTMRITTGDSWQGLGELDGNWWGFWSSATGTMSWETNL